MSTARHRFRDKSASKTSFVRVSIFLTPLLLVLYVLVKHKKRIHHENYLLWMTPRTGGFNNQLITIYEAIRCAQLSGRRVVVPLIYENVRADTSSKGFGPYPFEDYFNMEELRKIVPATTPREIDELGIPCKTIYFATSKHFKANERRIPRLLKQQYVKRYPINLTFVEDTLHPEDKLCVDDSFCPIPPEFGPYSMYNESGQGYDIRKSPFLQEIRAAFKPSKIIEEIARHVLNGIGEPFNSMHVRRGDFETKCEELPTVCEEFGNNSFIQSRQWIAKKAAQFSDPNLPLFISTTHSEECRHLLDHYSLRLIFMEDYPLPKELAWTLERTDIISFASQIVSSHAKEFVGNRFSSYTTEIYNMRYFRNPTEKRSFF